MADIIIPQFKSEDQVPADWAAAITWPTYFYKQQRDFTLSDKWQRWFIGGNGTGKTHVLYWNVNAYMLGIHPKQFAPPPLRVRVIVPSFDSVEDVALEKLLSEQVLIYYKGKRRFKAELDPMLPASMITKGFTRYHRTIELMNGSSINWVTNEQGWQFMRGSQFDILAIDEECDYRVYDENLRGLRNAKGGGCVLAALTPPYEEGKGPTWTKEMIVDGGNEDVGVITACMADNPAITTEYIKRFSHGKTKRQIDTQVYGKYPTWGDLVYPNFDDRLWDEKACDGNLLPNDHPMPGSGEVDWVMAFDWHQSKPCAAVFGWVDGDGNVVIFDELDKELARGKQIDDLADIFRAIEGLPFKQRRFRRWQDPSAKSQYNAVIRGFNAWDAFRKEGIVTSAGKNRDPDVGISIVNSYFNGNRVDHPRLFVYERCKYLRQGLNNHYYKRGEDGKGKPDPKWSDYPICLRYILEDIGWKSVGHRKGRERNRWPLMSYQSLRPTRPTIDISHRM